MVILGGTTFGLREANTRLRGRRSSRALSPPPEATPDDAARRGGTYSSGRLGLQNGCGAAGDDRSEAGLALGNPNAFSSE
jgi:hypothetical protein